MVSPDATLVLAQIRHYRTLQGIGLRDLADRVRVSRATLSAIENGHTALSVERACEIADALAIPVAALFHGLEPRPLRRGSPTRVGQAPTRHWRHYPALEVDPVLGAAIQAFVTTGYDGASIATIATSAGISVRGVYRRYPSKQAMLLAILEIAMDELCWRLEQARDEGEDPLSRLALTVESLALFHARRRDLAFIGYSEMRSLEPLNYYRIASIRNYVQNLLDSQIRHALEGGYISPHHPKNAGKAIATMCTALAQWFHVDGRTTPEQIAAQYAEFALDMLGQGRAPRTARLPWRRRRARAGSNEARA